jgi:hypothetical protein
MVILSMLIQIQNTQIIMALDLCIALTQKGTLLFLLFSTPGLDMRIT